MSTSDSIVPGQSDDETDLLNWDAPVEKPFEYQYGEFPYEEKDPN
jgi:hypothetical protein